MFYCRIAIIIVSITIHICCKYSDPYLLSRSYHVGHHIWASLALALLEPMEKVDVIEQRALEAPRELSVSTIDQLQTILLVVLAKLVVVPGERCQWCKQEEPNTV